MLELLEPPLQHPTSHGNPVLRERRKAPRLPLTARVDITSRCNFYAGRARDISAGGLFIETTADLDLGDEIGVRVEIQSKIFAVGGEVVWLLRDRIGRGLGVGVRFLRVPPPMRATIDAFMRRRAPIGFDFEESPHAIK